MAFSLNDPVHVNRENRQLEGVVAFLGSVAFADGDDWVGVRLTGSSVGLGRNDGTVQGKRYFDCPPQCGLFVKKNLVSRRQLTRLEELRLKRELASNTTDGATAATPASTTATRMQTPIRTPASSTVPPSARTPGSTTSSRLEEIRKRRAQLQDRTTPSATSSGSLDDEAKPSTTPAVKTSSTPATPMRRSDSSPGLQKTIDDLEAQLKAKDIQVASLKADLEKTKKQFSSKSAEVTELQKRLLDVQPEDTADTPKAEKSRSSATSGSLEESQLQVQQLQAQLDRITEEHKAAAKEAQEKLDEEKENIKTHQV